MEKILLCSFVIFTCFSISVSAQDLTGKWRWNSGDGQVVYSLDLNHISKDRIRGVHCVQNFQRKITECFESENEYTVTLVQIAENIFQGNLLSGTGKDREVRDVQIQYLPLEDRILFTLTKVPEKPFLVPVEAILQR
jgi:hypothetical protein